MTETLPQHTYGWNAGAYARMDNMQRVVPNRWQPHADAWLRGYDAAARELRQKASGRPQREARLLALAEGLDWIRINNVSALSDGALDVLIPMLIQDRQDKGMPVP